MCEELPPNFGDDLLDKPAAQRQWRWDQQHGLWGYIDPSDKKSWLRHLDYYVKLQQMADESLGTVLGALEESGAYDDTIIIFTSDHGDMCGSHGLRSKGPFVYEEIMHVPCYVKAPGITQAGSQSAALGDARRSRVDDLRARRCRPHDATVVERGRPLAGARRPGGERARPRACSRTTPRTPTRSTTRATRSAVSSTAGRSTRGTTASVAASREPVCGARIPGHKLFDVDADFVDQEHEWYDLREDPAELVNLAHDGGRRDELHENYERLLEYEKAEFSG